jgi:hypothetical protein
VKNTKMTESNPFNSLSLMFKTMDIQDSTGDQNKLRSSEQDLQIVVQCSDEEGHVKEEKVYHVYAQVYAKHSKFVDAALTLDMQEKQTKTIVFPDTSPKVFELAMHYLESPVSARRMGRFEVMTVLDFYDKYEFQEGLKLCDQVLVEFFRNQGLIQGMDSFVRAIVVAHQYQLKQSLAAGWSVFSSVALQPGIKRYDETPLGFSFGHPEPDTPENRCRRAMFSLEHIQHLQPFIVSMADAKFLQGMGGVTREDLQSNIFPMFFFQRASNILSGMALLSFTISGTQTAVDGNYVRDPYGYSYVFRQNEQKGRFQGLSGTMKVSKSSKPTGDWVIVIPPAFGRIREVAEVAEVDEAGALVLWKCPDSHGSVFPPCRNWKPVHRLAIGTPKFGDFRVLK